jgi:hypothetical protein
MRVAFAALLILTLVGGAYAQNSNMGGTGAGEYVGGLGGGIGFGVVAGTVGSAPSPPAACNAGQLDFSINGCSLTFYMLGVT